MAGYSFRIKRRQAIGIPKKIMPVKDIVEEMIEQARAIHKCMASIGMEG
jgi:hypothetical protein